LKNVEPIKLLKSKWALVYCSADEASANVLVEMFTEASKRLGVVVEEPQWVCLATIREWKAKIEKGLNPSAIQVVVVVLAKKEQK
jgi:hypothetical protein